MKIRIVSLLTTIAAILLATPASAEYKKTYDGYFHFGTDDDGSTYHIRVTDWMKIEPKKTTNGTVWIKVNHSKDERVSEESSTILLRVNCVAYTSKIERSISHMTDGMESDRRLFKVSHRMETPFPGTVGEFMLEWTCLNEE